MTSVYINYPNPHLSVRHGISVDERIRHMKDERRVVRINSLNVSEALAPFIAKKVDFSATKELNDLWLEIDFGDEEFEEALVRYVQRLLGRRYRPIGEAAWT